MDEEYETPTPGIEPGSPARQAGVLAIGQRRQYTKLC